MRGDLEKIPGIKDIKTDIKATEASFKLPKDSKVDLKAKLTEFAKTNKHMKGWSFIDDGQGGKNKKGEKA